MDDTQGESTDTGPWYEPTRAGIALAGGLIVIMAVVAAPQFVLDPPLLVAVLLAGGGLGVTTAVASNYWTPSWIFLVLTIPLVFLAARWLRETLGLAPPTLLVGLSAVVVGGTVTDILVTSR